MGEGPSFPIQPPVEPMLAKLATELPPGDGWLYEPKWDGFRAIVFRDGPHVYVQSRDLKPLAATSPSSRPGSASVCPSAAWWTVRS